MIDLNPRHHDTVQRILAKIVPECEACAFGSRVSWTAKDYSDLDLAVKGRSKLPTQKINALKDAFEESDLPFRVDVLDWHRISESFQKVIEQEYEVLQKSRQGGMKWRELPFTEAVLINPKVQLEKGRMYPFVEMRDINPSRRNVTKSEQRIFTNGGARFDPFDTLLARITPCLENGKIARYVPGNDSGRSAFGSTEFMVIRGKDGVTDNDYAYYLTRWSDFRQFAILQMTGSSGRQRVPVASLAGCNVPIPSIPEQRAIAHILGALDDKIELNQRMNHTLEAMARTIFKSWFVDFEPVHAKAQGRDTGLPDEIAALFPDSFQDSELGKIPAGWGTGSLKSLSILKSQTVQPNATPEKVWEHYSIPAFDQGRQPIWETGKDIKSGKYVVPRDSVLASRLNPQFPRVWLPDVQKVDAAICSTEFMPFVPRIKAWRSFLFELVQSRSIQSEILSRVTGSTGSRQRVKPAEIAELPCLVPPEDLINIFCSRVSSLHDCQLSNIRQSATLTALRDTLLPKLISGELRLSDAEQFVEEVGA